MVVIGKCGGSNVGVQNFEPLPVIVGPYGLYLLTNELFF